MIATKHRAATTLWLCLALVAIGRISGAEFFPSGVFDEKEEFDRIAGSAHQELLEALGETSLYTQKTNTAREVYRFIWRRSFHRPVVLRVEVRPDGSGEFVIKVGENPMSDRAGQPVRNETRVLNSIQVGFVKARFGATDFFKLAPFERVEGMDGATWTVEALVHGRYHLVTRWSPTDAPIRAIGTELIEMAIGGDFTPIY